MNNNARDVEIYLENTSAETCFVWLNEQFDALTLRPKTKGIPKKAQLYSAQWHESSFLVLIYENVITGYTSIWIDSSNLPWNDDEDCGKAAASALNTNVRITAGGWQQNDEPDLWLEITPAGDSQRITWKTA